MKTHTKASEAEDMDSELHDLFLDELADIYNAEKQLTKALPKLAKAAESEELKNAFQTHLEETEEQVSRLEKIFNSLDEKVRSKKCKGMEGIVEEGAEVMEEQSDSSALDAALISAAQKAEHYEIASYGTLVAWAEQMGHGEAVDLLKQNLEEEKMTDEKLTALAVNSANEEAD